MFLRRFIPLRVAPSRLTSKGSHKLFATHRTIKARLLALAQAVGYRHCTIEQRLAPDQTMWVVSHHRCDVIWLIYGQPTLLDQSVRLIIDGCGRPPSSKDWVVCALQLAEVMIQDLGVPVNIFVLGSRKFNHPADSLLAPYRAKVKTGFAIRIGESGGWSDYDLDHLVGFGQPTPDEHTIEVLCITVSP